MVRSISQKAHLEQFRISHSTLKSKFASGYSGERQETSLTRCRQVVWAFRLRRKDLVRNHNGSDRCFARVV